MGRALTRAQKMIFTPQSPLKTPWMLVFLSRQPSEHLFLLTFPRMLFPLIRVFLPSSPHSASRWGTAWSGVGLRASAQLINVEITKCVPWSFAALSGNGLLACCTSTDLEILPSLGWLQKKSLKVFREERNYSGPLVGDTSAPAESVSWPATWQGALWSGCCVLWRQSLLF